MLGVPCTQFRQLQPSNRRLNISTRLTKVSNVFMRNILINVHRKIYNTYLRSKFSLSNQMAIFKILPLFCVHFNFLNTFSLSSSILLSINVLNIVYTEWKSLVAIFHLSSLFFHPIHMFLCCFIIIFVVFVFVVGFLQYAILSCVTYVSFSKDTLVV